MCYEDTPDNEPYDELYRYVGLNIVNQLNLNYNLTTPIEAILQPMTFDINTGFPAAAINYIQQGTCDMSIGSTITGSNTPSQAHYLCPYGSVTDIIVRGPLDSNLNLSTIANIKAAGSGVKIAVVQRTPYVAFAQSNFPNATLFIEQNVSASINDLETQKAHILLFDNLDFSIFSIYNSNTCTNCRMYPYCNGTNFGGFLGQEIALECYGVNQLASNVCSGHGYCVAQNDCVCESGYTGSQCENAIKTNGAAKLMNNPLLLALFFMIILY